LKRMSQAISPRATSFKTADPSAYPLSYTEKTRENHLPGKRIFNRTP
jgi:hypothetical protein